MTEISKVLENDLAEIINNHAMNHSLDPQTAAATLATMALDCLNDLAWKTQSIQCADIYLNEALQWLTSGKGIPVLSPDGCGDKTVLHTLISTPNTNDKSVS